MCGVVVIDVCAVCIADVAAVTVVVDVVVVAVVTDTVVVVAAVDVDISKNVWKPIVACPNPIIWVVVLVQVKVWWLQKSTP